MGRFRMCLSGVGISHEALTQRLIQDPESDVHRILWQYDRVLPEKVVTFLRGEQRTYCNDIIASQLDADRFDYLLRDNFDDGGAGMGRTTWSGCCIR